MEILFLGGHPALDFLNSAYLPDEQRVETIGDGRALLEWLIQAGLLTDTAASKLQRRSSAKALDATAAEARKLRDWARDWLIRWRAAPTKNYEEERHLLNKHLERSRSHYEILRTDQGFELAERADLEGPDALLGLLALEIGRLLTEEEPALVKSCAGADCTLWFVDRTK